MPTLKNDATFKTYLTIVLFYFIFGALLSQVDFLVTNVSAIVVSIMTLPLVFYVYDGILHSHDRNLILWRALGVTLVAHLATLAGVAIFDTTHHQLWVTDSMTMHVPGALRLKDWFFSQKEIVRSSIYDRTYLAHVFASVFFAVFGVNQVSSALAMIVPKLIAAFFVFKTVELLSNTKVAGFAVLIYALIPTSLFYTLTFYKEATTQMFVSILTFLTIKLIFNFDLKYLLFFFLVLAAAGNERHYLVPCYMIGFIFPYFFSAKHPWWFKLLPIPILTFSYYLFLKKYDDVVIANVYDAIIFFRDSYLAHSDVTSINKHLPYPLAVLKLYLSPIFSPEKLDMFQGFATTITWGSFVYNMIAVVALLGVKSEIRPGHKMKAFLIWAPMILFILVFAYVSPYNGRLRDSFLPVIAAYAAIGFEYLRSKSQLKFISQKGSHA